MTMMKKKSTSAHVLGMATDCLSVEVNAMSTKSDAAMSIFKSTVANLMSINKELRMSADRARQFAKMATDKADAAERKIAENESVCQRIYEIIGQPAETSDAA